MNLKAQVIIDNSTCKINNLSVADYRKLKKLLSYKNDPKQSYFSGRWDKYTSLLTKKGEFPTGLLYLVKGYFKASAQYIDKRIKPTIAHPSIFDLKLDHIPRQEQDLAANLCEQMHRGIVSMPTGSGKSLVIALIIQRISVKTLVVVPTLELKRQLTKFLSECFGANMIGSWIYIENVDALDPKTPSNVDMVIIDEFHHAAAKTYRKLNKKAWANVYYRIGTTATPFRADENEKLLLESVLSPVIYRLTYKEAVLRGYIVPVEAYYYDVPKSTTNKTNWKGVYNDLVVNNRPRNKIIANILRTLWVANISSLCLVKELLHGHNISELSNIYFTHGQDDNFSHHLDNFNKRVAPIVLIGTEGVLSEGVDTRPCEYVIVAGLGKSKTQLMQKIGRAVRIYPGKESAKIILFRDESHKWTLDHFRQQCRVLRDEYGIIPVKIS